MKVIAVASQKGGSGKTTLAGHLAVQAEMAGQGPVALVDTDPQGSLSEWWNEREAETPLFARTTVERLGADIGRMEKMGINLLIIPTRPSPHDLRAVGATVELAEGLNTPLIFVVNGATPRARITSEAAIALSQHGTLAPSIIHQRVDFASSMIDGRTTMELDPASRSSEEISKLWTYIEERLSRMDANLPMPPSHHLSASRASNGTAWN